MSTDSSVRVGDAVVALEVGLARASSSSSSTSACVGVERHLHLVDDVAEDLVDAGVEDLAEVLQAEALGEGRLADADPGDVALADVLDALGAVDEVVDLALEHRLEVLLHLAAGDLDDDAERHGAALRASSSRSGPIDRDLAVLDLVGRRMRRYSKALRALAAELDVHVLLADALALEGRAVGDRDRAPWSTLTLTPRTSMQRWTSFSARSRSSAPGISSNGIDTTCS